MIPYILISIIYIYIHYLYIHISIQMLTTDKEATLVQTYMAQVFCFEILVEPEACRVD